MTAAPELIGSGRMADVFAIASGRVLRRYRDTAVSAEPEAAMMSYLRDNGYPVPEVFDADGTDLVMERIEGETMLAALLSRPWSIDRQMAALADLHDRLHRIPPPPNVTALIEGVAESVVHLDLHPDNVILTASGPVVIDWTNACLGSPGIDLAQTWMLLKVSVPPAGALKRAIARVGQSFAASAFAQRVDRAALDQWLPEVIEFRRSHANVLPAERKSLQRLATSTRRPMPVPPHDR